MRLPFILGTVAFKPCLISVIVSCLPGSGRLGASPWVGSFHPLPALHVCLERAGVWEPVKQSLLFSPLRLDVGYIPHSPLGRELSWLGSLSPAFQPQVT